MLLDFSCLLIIQGECVDWIRNFINFEPGKFGGYLVNFIKSKFQITVRVDTYIEMRQLFNLISLDV